ncbi:hypothetical protein B0H13DRAFT_2321733 [Mycena leptocephala]|nr:hypothetical protein B0H13DRAFT_2321733 [Mycena leptocephala]
MSENLLHDPSHYLPLTTPPMLPVDGVSLARLARTYRWFSDFALHILWGTQQVPILRAASAPNILINSVTFGPLVLTHPHAQYAPQPFPIAHGGITRKHHPHHAFVKLVKASDYIRGDGTPEGSTVAPIHFATCSSCSKTIFGVRYKVRATRISPPPFVPALIIHSPRLRVIAYPGPPPQPRNTQDPVNEHCCAENALARADDWGAARRGPSSLSSLASQSPRSLSSIHVPTHRPTSGPRSTTSVAQDVHRLQLAEEETRTNRPKASGMGWYASYWIVRDGRRSSFRTHDSFSNWSIMELVPDAAPHLVEKDEPLEDGSDTSSVLLLSPSNSEDEASPGLSEDDDDE